jgi:heptosyltransferase-2
MLTAIEQPLPPEVKQRFQQLRPARKFSPEDFPVPRLLVRSPNWVGDAVMSLPVLSGLARLFPQAEITVLAVRRVAPLFQGFPGVVEVIPYPSGRGKWQVLWGLRGHADLALTLPNSLESALGLWLVGVPLRVGYAADARRPLLNLAVSGRRSLAGLHTVYYYLGLLQALGEVEAFTPPNLYLRELEIATAAQLLPLAGSNSGPWVGLSPGAAYGPAKRWPPEHFAAAGKELAREFGARLVLLGGKDQRFHHGQPDLCRMPHRNIEKRSGQHDDQPGKRHGARQYMRSGESERACPRQPTRN